MVDTNRLLDALMQRGLTESSQRRIENSLNDNALAEILEQQFGVARTPQPTGAGASRNDPVRWDESPRQDRVPNSTAATRGSLPAPPREAPPREAPPREAPPKQGSARKSPSGGGLGGLGDLFGKSFKQALGAGALALLTSIAMKALRGATSSGAARLMSADSPMGEASPLGGAEPCPSSESLAGLTIKAMINAAKADGRIDEDEFQKIVGELQGDQLTQAERDYVLDEARKPMCTPEIIRAAASPQVAAQLYAASLLAIEVDTPREQDYLRQLSKGLGLDSGIVRQIHETLGVT